MKKATINDVTEDGVGLDQFLYSKDAFDCTADQGGKAKAAKRIDFEKWRVLKILGQGAFAKVYLVRQTRDC